MNIIWNPHEIESRSMEIIEAYLEGYEFSPLEKQVVKRVIHTTGDPEIARLLCFHPQAIEAGLSALYAGAGIFTDVNMLKAGINADRLKAYGDSCGARSVTLKPLPTASAGESPGPRLPYASSGPI